ncbi:DNA repair protein RecO [Neisseriaceae bacterium B1]
MSRINHQPAFLLASCPWRENSLRIEIYSRDYGRLSLLARSARARGSELRGVLVPFVPLSLSWFGKEELKTLHRAEWLGGWAQPKNRQLLSAHYLNELLLKLSVAEDPHPQLYQAFAQAQQNLAHNLFPTLTLRHFEWQLLTHLGLAPSSQHDENRQLIEAEKHYFIKPEHAAKIVAPNYTSPAGVTVSGSLLQQLNAQQLSPQSELTQALALTRLLLDFHIPNGIKSRQILQQLNEMKKTAF